MKGAMLLSAIAVLALAACDNMANQPKRKAYAVPYGEPVNWPPLPPHGIVARDEKLKPPGPPPVTLALLKRGQERFNIYCSPCHGRDGHGNGMVVQRGFPKPPSFHEARLVNAPDEHFVDVITNGHGVMYSYADRVPPADRWAITAYIRALQRMKPAIQTEPNFQGPTP